MKFIEITSERCIIDKIVTFSNLLLILEINIIFAVV